MALTALPSTWPFPVPTGVYDYIKSVHPDSELLGFANGPKGVFTGKYYIIDAAFMDAYRVRNPNFSCSLFQPFPFHYVCHGHCHGPSLSRMPPSYEEALQISHLAHAPLPLKFYPARRDVFFRPMFLPRFLYPSEHRWVRCPGLWPQ